MRIMSQKETFIDTNTADMHAPPAVSENRGSSIARKRTPLGPYRRPTPRVLGGSQGVGVFSWARYSCTGVTSK